MGIKGLIRNGFRAALIFSCFLAQPAFSQQTLVTWVDNNATVPTTRIKNDVSFGQYIWIQTAMNLVANGNYVQMLPISTLGQNTTLTIPDSGSATDTMVTAKGAVTISGQQTFTTSPIFPTTGIILKGTSFNDTVQALAAQGQACTYTIPDSGAVADTFTTLKSTNAFLGVNTFSAANGLGLVGTSHTGTIKVQSTLGQTTAYTVPDPGGATGTFPLLQTTNVFTGVNTFSLANGLGLVGTSHTDTLKAAAATGQDTALTISDVGGATGNIFTMTSAQTAAGVLSRADMVTETGVVISKDILHLKNLDGSTLGTSAAAGKFGLSTTATFGSPAQLSLVTEVANNNTKTDACEFECMLPPDYVAGSAITVAIGQGITIGGGTLSVKTLTVDAFLMAADGTAGSNIGPAAQNMTNTPSSVLSFALTPTGLVAGNKLLIQIQTVLTETAASAVTANLNSIAVTTSVKM